jgi:penicillin-binding protein 2
VRLQNRREIARRATAARSVVFLAFGALAVAFFRVQVVRSHRYQVLSKDNRLRHVVLPAPRGLVTDRTGVVLAENVPGYSVLLHAETTESLIATLDRLAYILPTDSLKRLEILRRYAAAPSEPVLIERDVPFNAVSALEEQRPWNPGLTVQSDPKRRYPFGPTVAHVVGYVGEINEDELGSGRFANIRAGTLIGRAGIEQQYDENLRGKPGQKYAEVDALGRTVRDEVMDDRLNPEPGTTIRTTLDLALQQFVEADFPEGRRGAVVAMDPSTGEVLALYSAPSYDPNAFIGGIDPETWRQLVGSRDFPLFNRAIQARYPPASPFKLAIAAMALERGEVDITSHMAIPCRGGLQYYTRYFRCWRVEGHGDLALREAIQFSCDVYFYQLGLKLGLESLLRDGAGMGFAEATGIDLPNEKEPIFPPSTEYYDRRYGPRGWTNAVTLNLSIGQGENTQTLINMVRFYAMLANPDGATVEPHLVAGAQGRRWSLGLSDSDLRDLRQALIAVVDRGTATGAQIADLRIAGKTGTAQNAQGEDHGWFIGFAPAEEPQIVVGAIVEFAEHGSSVAPLVTRIMARYLLGADALQPGGGRLRLDLPADSAPEPLPILPDTALIRNSGLDSARATPQRNR